MPKLQLLARLALAALPVLLLPAGAGAAEPSPPGVARGLLTRHGDRLILAPCQERAYVDVSDATPARDLRDTLAELGLGEGRWLYVELAGSAENGNLQANALNFAHTDARCYAPRTDAGPWRAVGRAPDWRLSRSEQRWRLEIAGEATRSAEMQENAGPETTQLTAADKTMPDWEIRRETCRAIADGLITGWTARAVIDGRPLQGCAWHP